MPRDRHRASERVFWKCGTDELKNGHGWPVANAGLFPAPLGTSPDLENSPAGSLSGSWEGEKKLDLSGEKQQA